MLLHETKVIFSHWVLSLITWIKYKFAYI
jgi:hypothetical protein